MDAFIHSVAWHHMLFGITGNGDVWRVWFDGHEPRMQKLIGNESEFAGALRVLRALASQDR